MKKLIGMTDYCMELTKNDFIGSGSVSNDVLLKISNYANFLKQPLELWMFIPCDDDGNVLEEPKIENMPFCSVNGEGYDYAILKYQQAKEKCLFEGCFYDDEMQVIRSEKGIDLFYLPKGKLFSVEMMAKYNLQLTPTAIKQLSL